jgi:hypothetical protein
VFAGISQRYRPKSPRVADPVATNLATVPDYIVSARISACDTPVAMTSPRSPS